MGNYRHMENSKEYWIDLGARIKMERTRMGLTQAALMEKIGRSPESYRVLGRWEKGRVRPEFSDMVELCRVFSCELGYLLGEHDCKTRAATDIRAETGLSEGAIQRLRAMRKDARFMELSIISLLINETNEADAVLQEVFDYFNMIIEPEVVQVTARKDHIFEADGTTYGGGESWTIPSSYVDDLGLWGIHFRLRELRKRWRGDDNGWHWEE